jgi:hypothetical protein
LPPVRQKGCSSAVLLRAGDRNHKDREGFMRDVSAAKKSGVCVKKWFGCHASDDAKILWHSESNNNIIIEN